MSFVAEFDDQQRSFLLAIGEAQSRLKDDFEAAADFLDHMRQLISDQQRRLNEASAALPAHSVRTYQASIDQARASMQDLAASLQPKKRFAFKSRSTAAKPVMTANLQESLGSERTSETQENAQAKQQVIDDRPGSMTITDIGTHGITTINISTHPGLLQSSIIVLKSLSNVCIDLRRSDRYASVTLSDLRGCTVKSGDAESSLFISNCAACKIEGEAQQIRIHTSHDCDIKYVCRAARPVIEKSSGLRFLNLKSLSGTPAERTVVDDFSDLSGSGKNWSILKP